MRRAVDLDVGQYKSNTFTPASRFPEFLETRLSTVHPPGTILFYEGQTATGVYLVLMGSAKVSISSSQGKILILRIAQTGDLLGVNSTMTGLPYEATAATLKRCRTVFIPRHEFMNMHAQDAALQEIVLRSLGRYVSALIQATRELTLSDTAAEKLAHLLLRWCGEYGVVERRGIRITNEFTQEEIAQMICTSRETVTRLLSEFTKRGLIQMSSNTLFVRSRIGLESFEQPRLRC